jgi:predicted ArsR family transcriptional regulator
LFEEFEHGVSLRDIVTDILRDGHASISQVGVQLKQRGIPLHRLTVAGYLKALADDGYLEERIVPPAKTYRLSPGRAPRSVYEIVGEKVRHHAEDQYECPRLAVKVLSDLFHRPVFNEELRRAGFEVRQGVREISGDDRQAARRVLSRTPLKLPFNDPAYLAEPMGEKDAERLEVFSRHVLAHIVRDAFNVQALATTSKQVMLGEVD